MGGVDAPVESRRERFSRLWDGMKASFGLPAGLAMVAGLVLGFGLPAVDEALNVEIPTFAFDTQDAAAGLLETVATVTVAVVGVSFSVVVVSFTLTSSQLSPRVLRTFRSDRLSQAVLALFLGTFIFCLAVLVRLGARADAGVPNLSITVALLLAFTSFALFAVFIGHIATMLQPSTVIARIVEDAKRALGSRFPSGIGGEPDRLDVARGEARDRIRSGDALRVEADGEGYLTVVQGEQVIELARKCGGMVSQRIPIGDYVIPGDVLAEVWTDEPSIEKRRALVTQARRAFVLGKQRTLVQDLAFAVRQLADIALKGLSPGINDPTTTENAMEATTTVIIRFARSDRPSELRVDGDGQPRFLAKVPELDDLVRLGFEQVRVFSASYPVVSIRLLALLEKIEGAARDAGVESFETSRQARLLREGPEGEVPTAADAERVSRAYAGTGAPGTG